ncbi:MAG: sensor histidine kinase, partial [Pseudomonadota bacterium]|nr:sensor histidine kinase [Pseudomonadota bacterium]
MPLPPPIADAASTAIAAPAEPRSTGFGTTLFDGLAAAAPAPSRPSGSVFDVCHVGVLLRAVLFVQSVFGIGVLFVSTGWAAWVNGFAVVSGTVLPAVLLWLLVACAC